MRLTKLHQAGLILGLLSAAFAQTDFTEDGDLPEDVPVVPSLVVDTHKVRSAGISGKLFRFNGVSVSSIHDVSTSRRARGDVLYTMSFSPESVATSSGNALYARPVHNSDLRNLLQNAVTFGRSQDSTSFMPSFNTSLNGLELIMNAIASTPGKPTFNWLAYADTAQILLDQTAPAEIDLVNSFVGVVKNPEGALVAQFAIIPQVVVVPDGADPTPSPPSPPTPVPSTGGKFRLARMSRTAL